MRLIARPRSLFTFAFDVVDEEGAKLGSFRHLAFRRTGLVSVGGETWVPTWAATRVAVERNGRIDVQIEATGRSSMRATWRPSGALDIAPAGLGMRLDLIDDGRRIGSVGVRDLMSRTMVLDSDRDLPPLVAVSLFWLAVARRRRLLMR